MSVLLSLVTQVLHIALLVGAAPTVAGVLDWLDARLIGRAGPPILAPWRELARLTRKTPVSEDNVSVVAGLAPAVALGAVLAAASMVPSFTLGMAFAPLSDVLVVVSLLAVARATTALAALDSGAARPGLAAQSGSALAVLGEPALMLAMVTLALIDGSFNLDLIVGQQREGLLLPAAASSVALTAMLALLFAESSAPPDGLQEMASGRTLAMLRLTGWMRRLVWIDLVGSLFLPAWMAAADSGPGAWLIGLAAWAAKLLAFVAALSLIQTRLGKVPRHSLPDLLGVAALLALLATIMVLASSGTA